MKLPAAFTWTASFITSLFMFFLFHAFLAEIVFNPIETNLGTVGKVCIVSHSYSKAKSTRYTQSCVFILIVSTMGVLMCFTHYLQVALLLVINYNYCNSEQGCVLMTCSVLDSKLVKYLEQSSAYNSQQTRGNISIHL